MNGEVLLAITIEIVLALLGLSAILAFIRLVRGPSLPDRVVALDLIGIICVGFIAVYTIATNETVFLLPAIVLALIAFLGTVAFAFYVQKGGLP